MNAKKQKKELSQAVEGKVFFDTNILIYSIDEQYPEKRMIAKEIICKAIVGGNGVISTQCLQEFFNVAINKLHLSKKAAKEYVEFFADNFPIIQVSLSMILSAIDISIKTQFSFWDSLILSAAKDTGCIIVFSEDLNHGQLVEGSRILNPFNV